MKQFDELVHDYRTTSNQFKEMLKWWTPPSISGQFPRVEHLYTQLMLTEFFTAPASSKHHLHIIGGLSVHCVHVFEELCKQNPNNDEQNIILAFCHDLCKLNIYKGQITKKYTYYSTEEMIERQVIEEQLKANLPFDELIFFPYVATMDKNEVKDWLYGRGKKLRETYDDYSPSYIIEDSLPLGHGEKSVIMALQMGIPLTDEEMVAIRWHMGFDDKAWPFYRNNIESQFYPLVKALQRADQDATHREKLEGI